ncbi:hypothetical protein [Dyadobacter bucti]|uniref:hypothetical protein n=1 Tax=Dyadobacter bucti TaxID=2572203 RepID=UPI001108B8BA|nr:hypothetical protein [Dyadobacter bucti]
MKKILKSCHSASKVFGLMLGLQLLVISCKKDEPAPREEGRFIFYTQLDRKEFDAIDIYVNKKFVGKLVSPNAKRPDCNQATLGDMVKVDLPAGEYHWSAKQFLGGKEIDEWYERPEKLPVGECEYIKLTD